MESGWVKTATGDWLRGSWRIRRPFSVRPWFWLYRDGSRYTPTGRFADAVGFPTLAEAKRYADKVESGLTR